MDDKSAGTAPLVESAYVDTFIGVELQEDKWAVTGWNDGFSTSIGALFTTASISAIGESSDVDTFLRVELEEDKVSVTGWIYF